MTEEGAFVGLLVLFCIAIIGFAFWSDHENAVGWQAFSKAHKCHVVGRMSGDVFNTVGTGSNGQVVVGVGATPDKTGYACDDGVTYWR